SLKTYKLKIPRFQSNLSLYFLLLLNLRLLDQSSFFLKKIGSIKTSPSFFFLYSLLLFIYSFLLSTPYPFRI
ncbi:hypothetical protein CQA62_06805, partial [Helicobacter cholecystus]